jgi:hypothetical protein
MVYAFNAARTRAHNLGLFGGLPVFSGTLPAGRSTEITITEFNSDTGPVAPITIAGLV